MSLYDHVVNNKEKRTYECYPDSDNDCSQPEPKAVAWNIDYYQFKPVPDSNMIQDKVIYRYTPNEQGSRGNHYLLKNFFTDFYIDVIQFNQVEGEKVIDFLHFTHSDY